MKFGDYIRQKREANGWTQPEAAARMDIEQSYLSKLETGKSYPSEDIFNRLLKAYDIDAGDMSRSIFSAELDKLREIKEVRSVVLERQTNEIKFTRGWMVAGLVMLMLGGGSLGLGFIGIGKLPERHQQFHYKSLGIILPGEPLNVFDVIYTSHASSGSLEAVRKREAEFNARKQTMTDRMHELIETHSSFRGEQYVKKTLKGKRRYRFFNDSEKEVESSLKWFLAPAFMFLAGSIGCFFVSFRWR
ncbi:helix-turn-helix domain-containing protein [Kordiimonas sp. SCSIO 12610]|uniref:helix-turn-helix domain-containing protein n=1 Tax=Kordiimonas sp. SCSIO 12610 TaxID=2829597 RepID=UPI00210C0518|nr:helix-turn-helix transcriptional regulator [Kordiimonas sp. SCSIO 12610]UTW55547.1 helix-turn-helix transcriptional regulator [Kordiimonas sp. SCSIO 12610]